MMGVRVLLLAILMPTLVLFHLFPLLPRRGRLFGIAVPPEVRYGAQGAQLLRHYQVRLLPWTAGAVLIGLWIASAWLAVLLAVLPLVTLIAATWLFYQGRSAARPFGLPGSPVREAQLTDAGDRLGWRLLWFLPPAGLLGATALYLRGNWDRIPARFAIHWDLNGHPNGWSHRSAGGVYGPLILGALMILFLLALAMLTYRGARRGTQRSTVFVVMTAVSYLIALVFSMAGLSPFWAPPTWVVVGGLPVFLAVIALLIIRAYSQPEPEGETVERTPEECWHAGGFYYNPNDPALFVEKRLGIGFTINFGNRLSWVILGAMVVFIGGLAFLAPRLIGVH